jgi:hypothetical protein
LCLFSRSPDEFDLSMLYLKARTGWSESWVKPDWMFEKNFGIILLIAV